MQAAPVRRAALVAAVSLGVACWPPASRAQTPEQQRQMEYERQQREYWRQQEQQRQEQQRQQQIMNENARRQQDESRRLNQPSGGGAAPGNTGAGMAGGAGGSDRQRIEAELDRARAEWSKRPALPPERNPLLGRWMRPPSTRGNANDPFAQIAALSKGGACELFFGGGGVFEFRPASLVGSDAHMREQELDQVQYRGDAQRVVVIPKASFKLIEFHFDGPDRITWPLYNCTLVRVTGTARAAAPAKAATPAATPAAASAAGAAPAMANVGGTGVLLALTVMVGADGNSRPVSTSFFVLRHSADVALRQGGVQSRPGMSMTQSWLLDCQERTPACKQGASGLAADAMGSLRTDAQGKAMTNALPAGAYYVVGSVRDQGQERVWNVRVDLKPGTNNVVLDQGNLLQAR